jgi:hypothetical protein
MLAKINNKNGNKGKTKYRFSFIVSRFSKNEQPATNNEISLFY